MIIDIKHIQNLWDTAKGMLRGKFITLNVHIRKEESEINNLTFYLKNLKITGQSKPKSSQRKGIIRVRAENTEIGNKNNTFL